MSIASKDHNIAFSNSVEGLRGISLILITLTHYIPTAFFSGNIARPVAALMMVVTGYFLALTMEREETRLSGVFGGRFRAGLWLLFQRHIRIWPAVCGIILIYILLGYLDGGVITRQIHHTWPMYLLYMGNVVKMIYEGNAFPAHFWLIGAQEQFVFIMMTVTVIAGYRSLPHFLVIAVGIGVGARFFACMMWMPDHPALATETPFAVADALALGMLVRIAIDNSYSRTLMRRNAIAAIVCVFVLWATLPNTYPVYFSLVPLLSALVGCYVIIIATDKLRVFRLERAILSWPFLVLIGKMSLSLFMVHPLVNTILNLSYSRLTGQPLDWWVLALVGPPLSIAVAFLYFRAVEVPLRRSRSKFRQLASSQSTRIAGSVIKGGAQTC